VTGELERLEQRLAEAIEASDWPSAAELRHDDFVLTSSLGTGLSVDKAAWLETGRALDTQRLAGRDRQIEIFGDVGVVVWRMGWAARLDDDDLSGPYLVTDAWVRADARWRLRWRSWARLNAEFLREELCG
jgi:Domain of unknown function (DUF4440)